MAERSAGILLYRRSPGLEVLLGHMGGPFWAKRTDAAWSIPKGLVDPGEDTLAAARREFAEEIGMPAPDVPYEPFGDFRQRSGKIVTVYAAEHDLTVHEVASNTFQMEWPPRSGRLQEFPEIDDARWFAVAEARVRVVAGQVPVLDELERRMPGR
jgi:predicted NUDIX family NTP pyrophosphohydrolase